MTEGPVKRFRDSSPTRREAAGGTGPWVFPPDLMKHFCTQYMPPSIVRLLCKRMHSWIDYEAACNNTLKLIMDECRELPPVNLTYLVRNASSTSTGVYKMKNTFGNYIYYNIRYREEFSFRPEWQMLGHMWFTSNIFHARMIDGDLFVECEKFQIN